VLFSSAFVFSTEFYFSTLSLVVASILRDKICIYRDHQF
jgi:hypothetical protein